MIDPGFIDSTISSVIILGAFFPGIKAVQIIISCFFTVSFNNSSCFFLKSSLASFAYPPSVSKFSASSTNTNFPPKLSTCSLEAKRTSVADTTPPSLFAVAIACKPATPAPIIKNFAGVTVPAAVIIIGTALLNS